MNSLTIVQLVHSEKNWMAKFIDGSFKPIVLWALVEDMLSPGYRWVEGVIHDTEFDLCLATQIDGFLNYEESKTYNHMISFSKS